MRTICLMFLDSLFNICFHRWDGCVCNDPPEVATNLQSESAWREGWEKDVARNGSSFSAASRSSMEWVIKTCQSHRIHGIGIFAYMWLIFMVHVGKYTIHGSYGNVNNFMLFLSCFDIDWVVFFICDFALLHCSAEFSVRNGISWVDATFEMNTRWNEYKADVQQGWSKLLRSCWCFFFQKIGSSQVSWSIPVGICPALWVSSLWTLMTIHDTR